MLQFTHKQISKGIYQITCPGNLPGPGRLPGWGKVNTYLIEGKSRALLIDTGYGNADIKSYVESLTDRPLQVMNTHYHGDHSGGNRQFEEIWIGTNEVSSDLPPDEEQYILEPCAYGAQFEDDDFCAISYVPQQLEILQSEPIE